MWNYMNNHVKLVVLIQYHNISTCYCLLRDCSKYYTKVSLKANILSIDTRRGGRKRPILLFTYIKIFLHRNPKFARVKCPLFTALNA